jgi:hypothetical protein
MAAMVMLSHSRASAQQTSYISNQLVAIATAAWTWAITLIDGTASDCANSGTNDGTRCAIAPTGNFTTGKATDNGTDYRAARSTVATASTAIIAAAVIIIITAVIVSGHGWCCGQTTRDGCDGKGCAQNFLVHRFLHFCVSNNDPRGHYRLISLPDLKAGLGYAILAFAECCCYVGFRLGFLNDAAIRQIWVSAYFDY